MKPSKLGIGTFKIANSLKYSDNDIFNYLAFSIDSGVNLFDTSDSYGGGIIEKQIGKALKSKLIKRKEILISTKFGQGIGYNLDEVKKSLSNSLKRLNTDYIDYYFFHSGNNEQFDNEMVWKFLNNKKKEGVIKKLGLSLKNEYLINNDFFQIDKAKYYGIDVISLVYNFNFKKIESVIKSKRLVNHEIFTRVPLGKGNLSNYQIDIKQKRFSRKTYNYLLQIPSVKYLLWVLKNKNITTTLVGFSSFEQLVLNLLSYKIYNEKN